MADALSSTTPTPGATPQPGWIDRLGENLERRLRAIFRRLPGRPSLIAGGLFILVTFYLPLAINSCGGNAGPGRALVAGKEDTYWPSFLGLVTQAPGRGFYIVLLAWGALAVIVALATAAKRQSPAALPKAFPALAGAISFLILADDCVLFVLLGVGSILQIPDWAAEWLWVLSSVLALGICLRCLQARSVRASVPVRLAFMLAEALILLALGAVAYQTLRWGNFGSAFNGLAGRVLVWTFLGLYFLAPLALWYRHSLWPMADSGALWPGVRRRLALAYAPALLGQFWVAAVVISDVHVWGLIVCLAGVHLVALGYLRLREPAP